MKPIIIYYSRSGNTGKLANRVKESLNCEAIKVIPEEAYGNYIQSCLRAAKEKATKVAPAFVTEIPDLAEYDTILLGYPVWVQDMPAHLQEFMKMCNVEGKTVVPFVTYAATGYNWTNKTVERVCKGADVKLPFNWGMFKKDDYDKWISSIKAL